MGIYQKKFNNYANITLRMLMTIRLLLNRHQPLTNVYIIYLNTLCVKKARLSFDTVLSLIRR